MSHDPHIPVFDPDVQGRGPWEPFRPESVDEAVRIAKRHEGVVRAVDGTDGAIIDHAPVQEVDPRMWVQIHETPEGLSDGRVIDEDTVRVVWSTNYPEVGVGPVELSLFEEASRE